MAKGSEAKSKLIGKVIDAVGKDAYVGELGGKYYFWSEEDGNKMQVCISMTCPKVPLETDVAVRDNGYDFSDGAEPSLVAPASKPAELTQDERDNINRLIKELGL